MPVESNACSTINQPAMDRTISRSASPDKPSADGKQAPHPSFAKSMYQALCAFGAGGWIYFDLSRIESGEIERTRTLAPVAALYSYFGFWPAVGLLPALGCFILYKASSALVTGRDRDPV